MVRSPARHRARSALTSCGQRSRPPLSRAPSSLTGLAPNLLALSLVKTTAKIDISWTEWFVGIMPVGVLLFVLLPLIVYKIYPPELKSSPEVPAWAAEELKKMGRVTFKEVSMAVL